MVSYASQLFRDPACHWRHDLETRCVRCKVFACVDCYDGVMTASGYVCAVCCVPHAVGMATIHKREEF